MKKIILLIFTHLIFAFVGFAGGIYVLPILTAPPTPTTEALANAAGNVLYSGTFKRELKDSDFLHWGEGEILVGKDFISLAGNLAPGPDYQLYLSPVYLETADEFERLKSRMVKVGPVKTFDNFVVEVPEGIDIDKYHAVIIWCEAFGAFITAANYR